MHYYQFNIGDYASHTRHLTFIEDLIYRRLLDEYYLHERPLNACSTSLSRQIGMRENETEIKIILEQYFEFTDAGWVNKRADNEINKYHERLGNASKAGKASAVKRAFNGRSTTEQLNKNQEPLTINHKPVLKPKTAPASPLPDWLQVEAWTDYLETRKVMKSPMTDRAKQLAIAKLTELKKSGHDPTQVLNQSIYNGWKGLFPIKPDFNQSQKGKTRHEQLADKLADLTGSLRRQQSSDSGAIHGTAERLD